uniref:uncharacterized protein LOC127063448 isoform X3 n=1 Tax=Vespula vulgaris TaxID=7454 RepID=UPI00223C28C0|nr:uncharacterized protein LOC127063448 isoform X3 [Vespula vulgaris]
MCYNQIRVFLFDYLMILLLSVLLISGNEVHDTEEVDLSKCKLTQLGTEYRGSKMVTSSNVRCQYWQTDQPLHKVILCLVLLITIDYQHMVNPNITDADFPEKSMKAAKNYCRNPTKDPRGPWCYTLDPTLIDDECDIPLCNFGDCRISGTGAEYAGDRKISSSGKKCKSWAGKHKVSNNKSPAFAKKNFPDASLKKANRFCRNPDNNIGGPWCYVHDETYETIEKEYCDIPFCDDRDCLVYVRNTSRYSTLTTLNSTIASIKFWIKLWNPNDEYNGEFKILLSLLPIPTFASKIAEDWHVGVELMFSNFGSGQTYPDTNMDDYENTPSILLGSKWTGIWITWAGGFISMGMYGTSKPFFVGEYKKKDTISGLYYDFLSYYGIMGTNVLWSTEFCQSDCETHVTVGTEFTNVWPMQKSNNTYDIHFYVRANRNIAIQMYQNPINIYPCFTIIIDNVTSLIYQKSKFSMKQYLKQVSSKGLLNFWMWKKFTISILGPHLRLFYEQTYGDEEFLYVHYDLFDTLRWFSIGTEYNVAYWTLFCIPDGETHAIEDPWPPNCISDLMDYAYKGNQWFSVNEIPCIPWISKEIPEEDKIDSKFIDGSALRALNKCRNPGHSPDGPYCYIMTDPNTLSISKQYCPVRKCQSSECKMAGTANDYIGTLSTTRSGRTCAKWIADYELVETKVYAPETTTQGHLMELPRRYVTQEELPLRISPQKKPTLINVLRPKDSINRTSFNDSLYAEHSAKNASNYCRNPSRNIAGTWCYTTDPLVPQDLCDVRDCEMLEECIFLVHGHGIGRRLYVFPEYRSEGLHFSLKAWEPDQLDSITIVFTADDGFKSRYILKIGALDNEKILLYYQSESQAINLVKKKTLPHLLYFGKWSNFVIRIPRGSILLYYEGSSNPLFEWKHPEPSQVFLPVYYYYNSEQNHAVGVAFDCNSRCQIEKTETNEHTRILPFSIWNKKKTSNINTLTLMIRAKGVVTLPLFLFPATPSYYSLSLFESGPWIFFQENNYPIVKIFHKQLISNPLFTTNSWTNITIRWLQNIIELLCNDTLIFHYEHSSPLLFYFFSLTVNNNGWAIWSANCVPTDIDGPAIDGGWSEWGPWACSASCNGGVGTRTRLCNSPEPNVRGEPCIGPNSMTGRCNLIKCGDLTEDTIILIQRRIKRNHTSLIIKEYGTVVILSDHDIIQLISNTSVDLEIQWSHNGIFIKENNRIKIKDFNVVINRALLIDSGIYTITLRRVDQSYLVLKVVALAVMPNTESITIRETLPLSVICNCLILGYVYSDLKISWEINENIWKDYGITLPIAVNIDYVKAINKSHEGMWKCIVEQTDLNFKWITNIIVVKVIGSPNWRTYLMEDKLTSPIFGWMPSEKFVAVSALIIFLVLIGCIIIGSIFLIRLQESRKIKVQTSKQKKNKQ